jgi:hypothetical protein
MALGLFGDSAAIFGNVDWKYIPVIVVMLVLALKPKLLEIPVNRILRLLNRQVVAIDISISGGVTLSLYYLAAWFIFGFAFWLFVNAIIRVDTGEYLAFTAIHAASIVLGFLAVFAPGGIGVREGIIILLLTYVAGYQAPLPAIIAIGFRLVTSISELISFGVTWLIDR